MMKKLLLTAAALAALSSQTAMATTGGLYLKAEGGMNKFQDIKIEGAPLTFKSNYNFSAGAGVGYYLTDEFRTDLSVLYSRTNYSYTSTYHTDIDTPGSPTYKQQTKLEVEIASVLLNGYVDLFEVGASKVFLGAGIGASLINGTVKSAGIDGLLVGTKEKPFKEKSDVAYALHAGVSTEISDGLHLDATYSFRDFGKVGVIKLRSHNLTLGIRVDL